VPHLQTNVLGTQHLLEAVRRSGRPCRILVVSSSQVYQVGDEPIHEGTPLVPSTPYGLSKLAQDRLADRAFAEDGLDVVIARPFNHAGPRQAPAFAVSSFARQIARIEAGIEPPDMLVGNLDARRDMTDVRDVVDAYNLMMAAAPAGRHVQHLLGPRVEDWRPAEELLHAARVAIKVKVDQSRLRPSDVPVIQGDASRIRSELGWKPKIPLNRCCPTRSSGGADRCGGARTLQPWPVRHQRTHALLGRRMRGKQLAHPAAEKRRHDEHVGRCRIGVHRNLVNARVDAAQRLRQACRRSDDVRAAAIGAELALP
jgi:hypothetical protein